MKYYLYNSLANNGIKPQTEEGVTLIDAVGMDYAKYLEGLSPEDEVVLVGGDGTLNYFINAVKGVEIKNNIYLLGCGTGNDFLKDIGEKALADCLQLREVRIPGQALSKAAARSVFLGDGRLKGVPKPGFLKRTFEKTKEAGIAD